MSNSLNPSTSHTAPSGYKRPRFKWLSALRALGVVMVLGYHFFPGVFKGGFVGVDVFFVFSGFLITSLLVQEFIENGRVSLCAFYRRRVRRLLPAVLAMLLVCLPLSLLLPADFRANLLAQTLAVLSWMTNYFEVLTGGSYDASLLPHMFIHTWTLAVELQYYLIWGLVLTIVLPRFLERGSDGRLSVRRSRRVAVVIALVLAVASFIWMQVSYASGKGGGAAYMATTAHIYPLMLGTVVGLVSGYSRTKTVRFFERLDSKAGIGIVALCVAGILIITFALPFESAYTYYFGILLTSLLCCVILLVGRGAQGRLERHRESRLLNYLSDRSYSIYLFHWPLFIIFTEWVKTIAMNTGFKPGIPVFIATVFSLVLTFVCAGLCYRLVEKPFQAGRRDAFKRARREGQRVLAKAGPGSGGTSINVLTVRHIAMYVLAGLLTVACVVTLLGAPKMTSIEQNLQVATATNDLTHVEAVAERSGQQVVVPPAGNAANGQGKTLETPGTSGKTGTSTPKAQTPKEKYGSVWMIGDSVAIWSQKSLAKKTGGDMDAKESRTMKSAPGMIQEKIDNGNLPGTIIIALATNVPGIAYPYAVDICKMLPPGHRLIFVTGFDENNSDVDDLDDQLRQLPGQYPFVSIADWANAISDQTDLLSSDGVHFGKVQSCINLYDQVVMDALDASLNTPTS